MPREMQDGAQRGREDHEELGRFLEEAARFLQHWDIRGANEALKKAGAKATTMCGDLSESPVPDALLTDLIRNVQDHMDRPGRAGALVELPEKLQEVRRRLDHVAHKDAGEKITADEVGALPRLHHSARSSLPRPEAPQ